MSIDVGNFPFVEARWKKELKGRAIDLWVMHSAETLERNDTAEGIANFFKNIPNDPRKWASAHLNIDNDSTVRCVHDKDVAYAAPGANHNGIQVEHAGRARQSRIEWLDEYGQAMLNRSASICALYCLHYNLPATFRDASDLRAGGMRGRGITTHHEVSQAFRKSDHYDPGAFFPLDWYLSKVHQFISIAAPPEVVAVRIPNLVGASQAPGMNGAKFLCASDGGVFVFGGEFKGNMVGKPMNAPVVDIVAWSNRGYWLIGADGGIFTFGDAPGVAPYAKLREEHARGERAVRFGMLSNDKKILTLFSDDLKDYNFSILV